MMKGTVEPDCTAHQTLFLSCSNILWHNSILCHYWNRGFLSFHLLWNESKKPFISSIMKWIHRSVGHKKQIDGNVSLIETFHDSAPNEKESAESLMDRNGYSIHRAVCYGPTISLMKSFPSSFVDQFMDEPLIDRRMTMPNGRWWRCRMSAKSFVLSRSAHHLQAVDKFFSNIRYNPMVRKKESGCCKKRTCVKEKEKKKQFLKLISRIQQRKKNNHAAYFRNISFFCFLSLFILDFF